jgi:hypothetical protein
MRITLGEVRRVVREVLAEGGYSSESSGAGFMLVDPDGRMYKAEPTRVRRWLIDNTKMSGSERDAVMSTGEVTAGVLSRMKRDRIVRDSSDGPGAREHRGASRAERDFRSREHERDNVVRDRQKADRAYSKAVRDFAKSWEDPEEYLDPEGSASDAALGFFWTHEKEWPVWARLLDMRKSDIHANVTDHVYDAMMKSKKTRPAQ